MTMKPLRIDHPVGYPNHQVTSVTPLLISAKGVGSVEWVSKANVPGETLEIVIDFVFNTFNSPIKDH